MKTSNTILQSFERIPEEFSYSQLGEYVMNPEFISPSINEQVRKIANISFTIAFLETDLESKIISYRHLIDEELVEKNIHTLIGLHAFRLCSKKGRKQLQSGETFENVADIYSVLTQIYNSFIDTDTAVEFWNDIFASIQSFKGLSSKVRSDFVLNAHALTSDLARMFSSYFSDGIVERFADMFRESSQKVLEYDPTDTPDLLEWSPQTHASLVEEVNQFNTDSTADHVIRELKSIKLLKSIQPSLTQLGQLLESIPQNFQVKELRQRAGVFYFHKFDNVAVRDMSLFRRAQLLIHFILFADIQPWVVHQTLEVPGQLIDNPFRLAGHTFQEDRKVDAGLGSLAISQSHTYDQLSRLKWFMSEVDTLKENQRYKRARGSIRYSNHLFKFARQVDKELAVQLDGENINASFQQTIPSRLTSQLNTYIGYRLRQHDIELDSVTRHYFNDLARSYILNLYQAFYSDKQFDSQFPIFLTEEDKFFQLLANQNLRRSQLSQLVENPEPTRLFNNKSLSILRSKLFLKRKIDLVLTRDMDLQMNLITQLNATSLLDFIDRKISFRQDYNQVYDYIIENIEQSLVASQALDDIYNDFLNTHIIERDKMHKVVKLLSQLNQEQLSSILNLGPLTILLCTERYRKEFYMNELKVNIEVFEVFYQLALEQGHIDQSEYDNFHRALKDYLKKDFIPEHAPKVEFSQQQLDVLADKAKINILYGCILLLAKFPTIHNRSVNHLASILSKQPNSFVAEELLELMIKSDSLKLFWKHLTSDDILFQQHRLELAECFIRTIFERFPVLKFELGMHSLVNALPLDLIKAMHGLDNNLPIHLSVVVNECIESIRQMRGESFQEDLDESLRIITKDLPYQAGLPLIKSIIDDLDLSRHFGFGQSTESTDGGVKTLL